MAQVLIRNLDDAVVETAKRQAQLNGDSLEQTLRAALTKAFSRDEELFRRVTQRSREQTRGVDLDVTALIREDRDR